MLHFHAGRDVNERAAAEDRGVQRAEFVVAGRDDFAEPFPENLRMILQPFGRADKDHALFADRFLDVGIDRLAVELRFDAGEKFSFLLRNAEPLEGALHVVRHFFPSALRLRSLRTDSNGSCRNRSLRDPCSPNASASVFPEMSCSALQAKFADPIRVFFHVGDVMDGALVETDAGVVHVSSG